MPTKRTSCLTEMLARATTSMTADSTTPHTAIKPPTSTVLSVSKNARLLRCQASSKLLSEP